MTARSRAPNWSSAEIEELINGYLDRKDIIEGKFGPTLTAEKKKKAYNEIVDLVNAVGVSNRSYDQVKKQVADQKTQVKAKARAIDKDLQKTGGGQSECLKLSPIEDRLYSSLNPQTIRGIIKDGETQELTPAKEPSSNLRGQSPSSLELDQNMNAESPSVSLLTDDQNEIKSMKFSIKKTRILSQSPKENRITSVHAESVIDVERRKVDLLEELVILKRIKLRLQLKELQDRGIDVSCELQELAEIKNKNGL